MILKSGAPPPRRPGAAVRASPAPRRPHSNSLRSRAAAASPDPPAGPGGGTPGPGRSAAPAARSESVGRSSCRPGLRALSLCAAPRRRPHLQAGPLASAAAGLVQGHGLPADFSETGSEAGEPHERAAVRARLRRPRGGAPGGGPLSRARGPEDAGAGAGEGAGPRPAGGGRALGPSGGVCPPAGTPQRVGQPHGPSRGPMEGA